MNKVQELLLASGREARHENILPKTYRKFNWQSDVIWCILPFVTDQKFVLSSILKPKGDQPQAIDRLTAGLKAGCKDQVLLGVTGSGKTFTMANVIANFNRPTLVISPNKTLAAQLAQEYREFFPSNAVEYFVSYYDYYQPEAYIPQRDQYIEKEADINEEVERLRLSTTVALTERRDVIVVASVSCIYNLGSPLEYQRAVVVLDMAQKDSLDREGFLTALINLFYTRSDFDFRRSTFRVRGSLIDVYPSYLEEALRVSFNEVGSLSNIEFIDPLTGEFLKRVEKFDLYPAKHYLTSRDVYDRALAQIEADLEERLAKLRSSGKELEAHRLRERTNYDIEMIRETGYCNGIENYSRYFEDRRPGDPPSTLLNFFPQNFLLIIDESHITVPQIRGMYNGDRSRKRILVEYGFRLPSAVDNRPLRFDEFLSRINQVVYTSATPAAWEISRSRREAEGLQFGSHKIREGVIEQLIRPTGILDPEIDIRPVSGQIEDLMAEITERTQRRERTLVTTLTKRLAEELTFFLSERNIRVQYLHSDIKTLERSDVLDDLRSGKYDVVVGINLLREGLDLPEVSLIAILDADKEGFLRSETSLIQTMGRAARHRRGRVILYADQVTGSMQRAIDEVSRRRGIQAEYNRRNKIEPSSIEKPIRQRLIEKKSEEALSGKDTGLDADEFLKLVPSARQGHLRQLQEKMSQAASDLDFELAAGLRDRVRHLRKLLE